MDYVDGGVVVLVCGGTYLWVVVVLKKCLSPLNSVGGGNSPSLTLSELYMRYLPYEYFKLDLVSPKSETKKTV